MISTNMVIPIISGIITIITANIIIILVIIIIVITTVIRSFWRLSDPAARPKGSSRANL